MVAGRPVDRPAGDLGVYLIHAADFKAYLTDGQPGLGLAWVRGP